jgi:tripeptide aminopeptidase
MKEILAITLAALSLHAWAQDSNASGDATRLPVDAAVDGTYKALEGAAVVRKTLADLRADDGRTWEEQKKLTEIPAPPYKEAVRAQYMLKRFREAGLKDATIDTEGNVLGLRKGGGGPKLVVSAHMDTVFKEGTDVKVKEIDGRFHAPGIADNTRGLVALLSVIGTMNANNVRTVGDVLFMATVGEEELGNLRGVKALFRDHKDIDGFISIDGTPIDRVTNTAAGSHRYEVVFKGPGGHSFRHFGLPSAIQAMGRAVAKISDLETPAMPKTTFTVGTVQGGTSVNAIAGEARMAVDMRSSNNAELAKIDAKIQAAVKEGVAEENRRWKSDQITAVTSLIGDRPAGGTPADAKIVQAWRRSIATLGREVKTLSDGSTDSNIAMSLGVPAITIGGGGESDGQHSLREWYKPTDAYLGPQGIFLTLLGLAGLEGVSQPLLEKRAR